MFAACHGQDLPGLSVKQILLEIFVSLAQIRISDRQPNVAAIRFRIVVRQFILLQMIAGNLILRNLLA